MPVIVAAFSFGAYGLGYGIRGGAIVMSRVGIVEAPAGARFAGGHGYVGLFSPAWATYTLDLEGTATGPRDMSAAESGQSPERCRAILGAHEGPAPIWPSAESRSLASTCPVPPGPALPPHRPCPRTVRRRPRTGRYPFC